MIAKESHFDQSLTSKYLQKPTPGRCSLLGWCKVLWTKIDETPTRKIVLDSSDHIFSPFLTNIHDDVIKQMMHMCTLRDHYLSGQVCRLAAWKGQY